MIFQWIKGTNVNFPPSQKESQKTRPRMQATIKGRVANLRLHN